MCIKLICAETIYEFFLCQNNDEDEKQFDQDEK